MSYTVSTRWTLRRPDNSLVANVLECSEEWSWIVGCHFGGVLPSQLTDQNREFIEQKKAEGYRAVEVMLIPVPEARGR